jgi:hypothetical protein
LIHDVHNVDQKKATFGYVIFLLPALLEILIRRSTAGRMPHRTDARRRRNYLESNPSLADSDLCPLPRRPKVNPEGADFDYIRGNCGWWDQADMFSCPANRGEDREKDRLS